MTDVLSNKLKNEQKLGLYSWIEFWSYDDAACVAEIYKNTDDYYYRFYNSPNIQPKFSSSFRLQL